MTDFTFSANARTSKTALIIGAVWLAVLVLWLQLNASPWIMALVLLATLPAALDFARNRRSRLLLTDTMVSWQSGQRTGEVALARLEKVRFETRLDLSLRVRLQVDSGKRLTLPQDCLPRWEQLQTAFQARGIPTERHHFSLL